MEDAQNRRYVAIDANVTGVTDLLTDTNGTVNAQPTTTTDDTSRQKHTIQRFALVERNYSSIENRRTEDSEDIKTVDERSTI